MIKGDIISVITNIGSPVSLFSPILRHIALNPYTLAAKWDNYSGALAI